MFSMLFERIARLFAYAKVVAKLGDVFKWYPTWSFSSHRSNGYKKMMTRYGLKVPFWIVLHLILMGGVVGGMGTLKGCY